VVQLSAIVERDAMIANTPNTIKAAGNKTMWDELLGMIQGEMNLSNCLEILSAINLKVLNSLRWFRTITSTHQAEIKEREVSWQAMKSVKWSIDVQGLTESDLHEIK
jgi:ABC-type phosphate/phosphonate transport system ATPase subunit